MRERSIMVRSAVAVVIAASACGHEPRVLSPFGSMRDATGREMRKEPSDSVELEAAVGEDVIAAADGVVATVELSLATGVHVELVHTGVQPVERGRRVIMATSYRYLNRVLVEPMQQVRRGDKLGEVGRFRATEELPRVRWTLFANDRHHPRDPLPWTDGCFRAGKHYPVDTLVLTYPLRCAR